MTKYKRTQEDWIKIGTSLKKVRNELLYTYEDLSRRLGKSHKDVEKIRRAFKLVDQVRCDLEDQMFYEYPYLSNYWLNLFYGPETDFDPDGEEAKLFDPDPLHLKKTTKGDNNDGQREN